MSDGYPIGSICHLTSNVRNPDGSPTDDTLTIVVEIRGPAQREPGLQTCNANGRVQGEKKSVYAQEVFCLDILGPRRKDFEYLITDGKQTWIALSDLRPGDPRKEIA